MAVMNSVVRSIVSLAVLAILVIGVPWLLVSVAGWPLPGGWPDWSQLWLDLRQLNIADGLVVGVLAAGAWVLWAQVVWALAFEAANMVRVGRGLVARPAPFALPAVTLLVSRLVAGVLTISLLTSSPASAAATDIALTTVTESFSAPVNQALVASAVAGAGSERATVTVRDGETAVDVALRVFGDVDRLGELLRLNAMSAFDVGPGVTLELPAGVSAPAGEVTVVEGDHLWGISKQRLMDAGVDDPSNAQIAAHVEAMVYDNRSEIVDPDLIYPDQVFTVLALGEPHEPTVDQPNLLAINDDDALAPVPDESLVEPTTAPSMATNSTVAPATPTESSTVDPGHVAQAGDVEPGWLSRELAVGGGVVAAAVLALVYAYRRRGRARGTQGLVWRPTGVESELVSTSSLPLLDWVAAELVVLVDALPSKVGFAPVAVQWSGESLEVLWMDARVNRCWIGSRRIRRRGCCGSILKLM